MFSNRYVHAAVLLLALINSFVCASFKDDVHRAISSMQVPWIDGIDSFTRSTESSCADDLAVVSDAIAAGHNWTYEMIDASSKLQSGILKGNFRDLGMYDQCVEINEEYNGNNIQGQHCMVTIAIISSSVCVPSSCNETDVADLVNAAIQNVSAGMNQSNLVSAVSCAPVGNENFTAGEIVTITFFSIVVAFILFCTLCGFVNNSRPKGGSTVLDVLAKFSIYTNGIALLSTKINPQMMPALQGIRFLSMCWVVLGHRFANSIMAPMVNTLDFLEWMNSWHAVWIQAGPFAVDTFFVISGFLMSYLYLKSKISGKASNFHMMYIHRYLRLTPALGVLILFTAVLLHRVASGPVWESSLARIINNCQTNWWINLLYVQNFVRAETMCLEHSWYLAVDMQLFWISPFILYPLYRWPNLGLGILGSFLIASVVGPTIILALHGYSNAIVRIQADTEMDMMIDSFYKFYIPTYTRACAYLVGIVLGYDVVNHRRSFTRTNAAICWAVAGIFMLVCGLATIRLFNTTLKYNLALETVLALVLRPFWSIAIAWIIYACTQGYGGPLTSFLSLPIFMPLSRLSYCIYLVHMVIQLAKNAAVQIPTRFTDLLMLDHFWADLVLSIVVAFFLSLFFESPVVVLEKLLRTPRRKQEMSVFTHENKRDVEGGIENKGMTEI